MPSNDVREIMSEIISNLGHGSGLRQNRNSYLQQGLVQVLDRVYGWVDRHRTRGQLYQMPDYMLRDIGVSRAEVEQEWVKPFWKA